MTISAGSDILASDFISTSAGAGDSGKVPKLNSIGKLDVTFIRNGFGGTGADAALTSSSGTTTLSAASAATLVKNYTSISLTGTAVLAFSNPHAGGTIIILKVQGNATFTSSANPAVDVTGMGAANGTDPNSNTVLRLYNGEGKLGMGSGVSYTNAGGVAPFATRSTQQSISRQLYLACGGAGGNGSGNVFPSIPSGGAGGGSLYNSGADTASTSGSPSTGSGGTGGRGGGCLCIEIGGAFSSSAIFWSKGTAGTAGSGGTGQGGGGGGAGGGIVIVYNALTSDTGTYLVTGGAGGASSGGSATGGAGADGYTYIGLNTMIV